MTFAVRAHAYQGMQQIPNVHPKEFSSDSVFVMIEPYKWGSKLDSNGATPVTFGPDNTDGVNVIRVQVADNSAILYEINSNAGMPRVPSVNSPRLTGQDIFYFKPGWTFSFIEG